MMSGEHFEGAVGDEQAAASSVAPRMIVSFWRSDICVILGVFGEKP